jgi:hypothetical protein
MPRIAELLKLKFEMAYRGMPKDKAEAKFNEIVAPPSIEPPKTDSSVSTSVQSQPPK